MSSPTIAETTLQLPVAPAGHSQGALSIHPYFGRLDPALARALVEGYSRPGDRVLDPFCGSGTVLHEACLLGRQAIGWDSSPLAAAISLGKLSCATASETAVVARFAGGLDRWSSASGAQREPVPAGLPVPAMRRVHTVESWFSETAIRELALIRHRLLAAERAMPAVSRLLAWLSFSRIITRASNQQGESTYRRVDKQHAPGSVIAMYQRAAAQVSEAAASLTDTLGTRRATKLTLSTGSYDWTAGNLEVAVRDARAASAPAAAADLVVTSPPYLMSWDYGLYHKFRFYWLGMDLDRYEETEIGRHLRRRNDDVQRYHDDMRQVFVTLARAVKRRGTIAMVNAPSVVYGSLVDTNAVLAECAREAGWNLIACEPSLTLTGPHHGMYASLVARRARAPGSTGKQEHVLVFRRDD